MAEEGTDSTMWKLMTMNWIAEFDESRVTIYEEISSNLCYKHSFFSVPTEQEKRGWMKRSEGNGSIYRFGVFHGIGPWDWDIFCFLLFQIACFCDRTTPNKATYKTCFFTTTNAKPATSDLEVLNLRFCYYVLRPVAIYFIFLKNYFCLIFKNQISQYYY